MQPRDVEHQAAKDRPARAFSRPWRLNSRNPIDRLLDPAVGCLGQSLSPCTPSAPILARHPLPDADPCRISFLISLGDGPLAVLGSGHLDPVVGGELRVVLLDPSDLFPAEVNLLAGPRACESVKFLRYATDASASARAPEIAASPDQPRRRRCLQWRKLRCYNVLRHDGNRYPLIPSLFPNGNSVDSRTRPPTQSTFSQCAAQECGSDRAWLEFDIRAYMVARLKPYPVPVLIPSRRPKLSPRPESPFGTGRNQHSTSSEYVLSRRSPRASPSCRSPAVPRRHIDCARLPISGRASAGHKPGACGPSGEQFRSGRIPQLQATPPRKNRRARRRCRHRAPVF